MENLIDIKDLSPKEIDKLIEVAKDIMQNTEKNSEKLINVYFVDFYGLTV